MEIREGLGHLGLRPGGEKGWGLGDWGSRALEGQLYRKASFRPTSHVGQLAMHTI